jgi:hypothetical protein
MNTSDEVCADPVIPAKDGIQRGRTTQQAEEPLSLELPRFDRRRIPSRFRFRGNDNPCQSFAQSAFRGQYLLSVLVPRWPILWNRASLEYILQPKLNLPRRFRSQNSPKCCGVVDVAFRQLEVRVIEEIENLDAKLQRLFVVHPEVSHERQI